ncbi:hypothetical protein EUGRSUZ_K02050 [Eucalyptus grandis]|uniref:Uncharacterized protein n=2 Tax=Eucalyptus grandis TaxID=71139 RepID=A0ACC3IY22_EUCGR|nr:hypothetical protein EUGRSUZ_K02050 [Eucalyptus grandis]
MPPKMAICLLVFLLVGLPTFAADPDPVQDYCVPNPKVGNGRTTRSSVLPCKNSSEVTTDDFVFSGMKNFTANFSETGLAALSVNPTLFPGLNTLGMSFMKPATIFGSFNSQNAGVQKLPATIFGSGINSELLEKAFGLSPKQIGHMRRKLDPKTTR